MKIEKPKITRKLEDVSMLRINVGIESGSKLNKTKDVKLKILKDITIV